MKKKILSGIFFEGRVEFWDMKKTTIFFARLFIMKHKNTSEKKIRIILQIFFLFFEGRKNGGRN